ncbi:restriction endonuclease subunit S [Williamsoniiplasma lucivorax]|uniref:Type I restriction enzyme, S subunit n=1 Tax=Williamsoniiplasma lucivorax TaxID=209274 RepID=A0A2S5RFL6_9MOLU|nr:restriction endonuclease subunit S [Williamsoniiplasma lucivorax]PPE06088.1 type I restriction enzyme, S subunit [Williamsoniiplasma lucivorax]
MAIYKLGDICDVKNGSTPNTQNNELWKKEIPFLGPADLLTKENTRWITKQENKTVKEGSVLISTTASIGNIMYVEKESWFNQQITSITVKKSTILNSKFLFYYFLKKNEYIKKIQDGGSIFPIIHTSTFRNWKINIPSIEEQQNIIDIIEPIETLIDNIKSQISILKKIMIKQYNVLQTHEVKFVDFISLQNNKWSDEITYLATNAVGEFYIDRTKLIDISVKRPSRANIKPKKNTFLISKLAGENKMYFFNDEPEEVFSTGFYNFSTKYVDHITSFILSDHFQVQKNELSTGTTMQGINNDGLSNIMMKKPIVKENSISKTICNLNLLLEKLTTLQNACIRLLI